MKECALAMLTVFCGAGQGAAPDTTDTEADAPEARADARPEEKREEAPNALLDQALVYGATIAYSAAYGDVRTKIVRRGSWANIAGHFTDPVNRLIEGARRDQDPFATNYIAHPVSWALVGYYLRSQGHSFWSSFAMSQAHSMFWEYVIEGSYAYPSGEDMITNLGGSLLGIAIAEWVHGGDLPDLGLEVRAGPSYAFARGGRDAFASDAPAPPRSPAASITLSLPVGH